MADDKELVFHVITVIPGGKLSPHCLLLLQLHCMKIGGDPNRNLTLCITLPHGFSLTGQSPVETNLGHHHGYCAHMWPINKCTGLKLGCPSLIPDILARKSVPVLNKGIEVEGGERQQSSRFPFEPLNIFFFSLSSSLPPVSLLSLPLLFLSIFCRLSLLLFSLNFTIPFLSFWNLFDWLAEQPYTNFSWERPVEPSSQIAPRAHWIFLQMSNKRWTQLRFRETQKSILRLPPVTLRD